VRAQKMSYQRRGTTWEFGWRFFWLIDDATFTIDRAQFPDRAA
jgi:hypothetical protein